MTGLGAASSGRPQCPPAVREVPAFLEPECYGALADVPNVATSSRRLLTPIFAKTDLR